VRGVLGFWVVGGWVVGGLVVGRMWEGCWRKDLLRRNKEKQGAAHPLSAKQAARRNQAGKPNPHATRTPPDDVTDARHVLSCIEEHHQLQPRFALNVKGAVGQLDWIGG